MRQNSTAKTKRELAALQAQVAGVIMRPLAPGNRMQKASTRAANAIVKPNDRLSAFERLEIYNRQYWFRILDCLYDDYPGLRAVIGEDKFDRLSRAYLAKYPSESFSLRNLGRRLEKFLRAEPKWIAPHGTLALDMARLEWAHIVAFDEGGKPPIEVDDLLGSDPAKVKLGLQPYISLLEVNYPVDDLLLAAKQGDARLRHEASNAVEMHPRSKFRLKVRGLKRQRRHIAVHRMQCSVYYKTLTREQFGLLTALQQGATLEAACAKASRVDPAVVQQWFADWASFGWFTAR